MRRLLKKLAYRLPAKSRGWAGLGRGYLFPLRRSAAQYGEDLIIEAALETVFRLDARKGGTYVDVGAFHPRNISNTWRLSKLGWRGVAIDVSAEKVRGFAIMRSNCSTVVAAVGASDGGEVTIYRQPTLLSGIDSGTREHLLEQGATEIFEQRVAARSLRSILDELGISAVDVLSVDIEGHDFEALAGLGSIRPKIIVIEDATPFPGVRSEISDWMQERHYVLYARCGVSLVYCQRLAPTAAESDPNSRTPLR